MDSNTVLRNVGQDVEAMFASGDNAFVRIDDDGWLGLSGEKDCADLNMAAVFASATDALLADYVGGIRGQRFASDPDR